MEIWIGIGLAVIVSLWALDQVMLWAERRGWIYWRKSPSRRISLASAFIAMQQSTNPAAQNIEQAREEKKLEERDNGDQEDTRGQALRRI